MESDKKTKFWSTALTVTKLSVLLIVHGVMLIGSVLLGVTIGFAVMTATKNNAYGLLAGLAAFFAGDAGRAHAVKLIVPLVFNKKQLSDLDFNKTNTK